MHVEMMLSLRKTCRNPTGNKNSSDKQCGPIERKEGKAKLTAQRWGFGNQATESPVPGLRWIVLQNKRGKQRREKSEK